MVQIIVRAAVKVTLLNGSEHIIPCHRHCDAFQILSDFRLQRDKGKDIQGFLNNNGDFLNRKDAMIEARKCGQIQEDTINSNDLFSEDLW